jgi:K+-transporting ATPase ATPase B chain
MPCDHQGSPLFDRALVRRAGRRAHQARPAPHAAQPRHVRRRGRRGFTLALAVQVALGRGEAGAGFIVHLALWLWFTLLFANFAEAMAEGRGKAQADSLRKARRRCPRQASSARPRRDAPAEQVPGRVAAPGDLVLVEAGQAIPGDGEVIEGIASVDESAVTGESAPVIRESGGDRSSSPAARACCPTGSSCASARTPARPSSTA